MSVRPARGQTSEIDGNSPEDAIIGMCGGDNALVLDDAGSLWCNGNSIYLAGEDGQTYSWATKKGPTGFSVTPKSGITGATCEEDIQTVLWDAWEGHWGSAELIYDPANAPGEKPWHWEAGGLWLTLAEIGLTADRTPKQGDSFTVTFAVSCTFGDHPQLVRMGAYVIIYPGWIWCDAVKLGAGDEMVEGEDYGPCAGAAYNATGETTLTLTLCDVDGEPYSGVVVSATQPMVQEGYWLDTGGQEPKLMEWSYSQTTWVHIASTFIKVEALEQEPLLDTLRKGDAVTIATDCDAGTDDGVVKLLNGVHYLYDADLADQNGGWVMIAGVLPSDSVTVTLASDGRCVLSREMPTLDFLVEAQNRLWGCRYSEEDNLNEIYGSKLGDFRNWNVFQNLSTDSWTASRGTAAPFTGAITMNGQPLFFREEGLEKVVPSSSGAHQILVYSLDGVQQGSSRSMVIIDEHLFYKSRTGVCVYSGTLPRRISEEFEDWEFVNATAARHMRKYCVCMTRKGRDQKTAPWAAQQAERLCMVYDIDTGDWHVEDETWDGIAITWKDELYYVKDGVIWKFDYASEAQSVQWYAESDDMSVELPEHKWITYVRVRLQLELGATCRVYFSFDDGPWQRKASLTGNHLRTVETAIWPRRCDHFRIRIEGTGGCEIQSISYAMESSQLKH
jgi:hypothetical protein